MFKVNKKVNKKNLSNLLRINNEAQNIVNDAVQEPLLFPHTKITDPSIVIVSE